MDSHLHFSLCRFFKGLCQGAGRLLRVRRGLYAVVPRGADPQAAPVDPYLVATALADDAVVAYHAALQFHGKVDSVSRRFHYLTCARARPSSFRRADFVPVRVPTTCRSWARPSLLARGELGRTRLRLGFVVYGGINRPHPHPSTLCPLKRFSCPMARRREYPTNTR